VTYASIVVERDGQKREVVVKGRVVEEDFSINSVVVEIDEAFWGEDSEPCLDQLTEEEEEAAQNAIYQAAHEDSDEY
jgi:hypothetical protein